MGVTLAAAATAWEDICDVDQGGHACRRVVRRVVAALLLAGGGSLMRAGPFSVHGGYGFLSLVLFMLWLLATSIALTVRASRDMPTTSRTQNL